MRQYYSREGKRFVDAIFDSRTIGDGLMLNVLIIEDVGDLKRYSIKLYAKDARHAERILMGVLRSVYIGITITSSAYSLYNSDFNRGYNLFDYSCSVRPDVDDCRAYDVVASGRLVYYH